MAINASAASAFPPPVPDDVQAVSLWTYVHLKVPRFTTQAAEDVIKLLNPFTGEDVNALAKRLRLALKERGVAMKHTAALEAAARLKGHANWHSSRQERPQPLLRLSSFCGVTDGRDLFDTNEARVESWKSLMPRLRSWVDLWLKDHPRSILEIRVMPRLVMVSTPEPRPDRPGSVHSVPLFSVLPLTDPDSWLDGAPAALEALRRHCEENQTAVVDGVAVMNLCHRLNRTRDGFLSGGVQSLTPQLVCNSELVVLREDDDLGGFEVARGDEMTCWSQLELASKDDVTGVASELTLSGDAWRAGPGRYVWELSTLKPDDYRPGLTTHRLGQDEVERLFRRYKLVKRILNKPLRHHEMTKRIDYLGAPAQAYRVDLDRLAAALKAAGLSWEQLCAELGHTQELTSELPYGFVMSLLVKLKVEDPNSLIALPRRDALSRADDDSMLRALLPRVDTVRYRLPRGASEAVHQAVAAAVNDFGENLDLQKMKLAGTLVDGDSPLPYLVYVSEAEELRLKIAALGLVAYVGVLPHYFSMEALRAKIPNFDSLENLSPFAFGHALYLHLDFL